MPGSTSRSIRSRAGQLAARAVALDVAVSPPPRATCAVRVAQLGDERRHPLAPARELLGVAVELRGEDGHARSLTGASAPARPLTEW